MVIPEYYVIERQSKSYVYLPIKKIYCEVTPFIGKALKEYQSNIYLDNEMKNLVEEFVTLVESYENARSVVVEHIEGITLILATDCNLRCSYCYADGGTYQREQRLMSVETAIKAIDFMFALSPSIRNIRFFGGEPLLNIKVIWEVCKYIEESLGRTDIYYTLETNGTIKSDDLIKLAKKYKFDISVSCDGPEQYHDLHRKCHNCRGTYQKVMHTVEKLREEQIKFGFQCTYTEAHKKLTREELTNHLTQYTPFYKISPMITDEVAIDMDHEFLFAPFEYLLTDQPIFHSPTIQMISGALSSINSLDFCEAQSRVTIFPDGDVYPCELLDHDQFYMGNVYDSNFPGKKFKLTKNILSKFNRDELLHNYWYRYLLNPVCIADLLHPDYDLNKKFILSEELESYYEELIIRLVEIENSDQRELFKKNLDQYLQGSRVRYEAYK